MRRVYVLLSVYNGEKYLEEQLESIYRQENVEIEVWIRDDASNDSSIDIINRWMKKLKIHLFEGENVGPAKSFYELIKYVKDDADFYAFCDQDDYWLPDKLECAIKALGIQDDNICALYYGKAKRVGSRLEEIEDPFKKEYHTEKFGQTLIDTAAPGCTMVFNRVLLMRLKSYEPRYLQMHDSWTLNVCAALDGKIIYDEKSYILYRQHVNNEVGGMKQMSYKGFRLLRYRIEKFLDCEKKKPALVAREIICGYSKVMSEENLELAEKVANANKSILNRWRIILDRRIKTPYMIINMKYYFQVLCGKS